MNSITPKLRKPDPEEASVGMMALFVIGLFMMLFFWILTGGVIDKLQDVHAHTSDLGPDMPMSDERVTTFNFLILGFRVMPIIGIAIPLIIYAVMVSLRKGAGGFGGGWG